jgi:hypothetical protein
MSKICCFFLHNLELIMDGCRLSAEYLWILCVNYKFCHFDPYATADK